MKLTKCAAGHFYDADKFQTCPHCGPDTGAQQGGPNDLTQKLDGVGAPQGKTEPLNDLPQSGGSAAPSNGGGSTLAENVQDVQKTIGIFNVSKGSKQPVVGWLVCIEGKDFGEDFPLRMGKNFIGRANNMDVVLTDNSVSRDKHSIIVYEPKGNLFIIQAGESRELSYLNDEVVLSPTQIKPYDKIKLGETTLLFVPLCGDNFVWEIDEKKD